MKTISSQRYINDDIVAEKISAVDFEVMVSPSFEIDGEIYRVVLDGHHSLFAAKSAGADPVFFEADSTDHDAVSLITNGDVEGFLSAVHMGDDYYDTDNGQDIW